MYIFCLLANNRTPFSDILTFYYLVFALYFLVFFSVFTKTALLSANPQIQDFFYVYYDDEKQVTFK